MSALYVGSVHHRRRRPHAHAFRYRIAQFYLDLDELPALFRGRWFYGVDAPRLASFRRADYFGDPALPLKQAVLDRVEQECGERPAGPVRLLTHLRVFGYIQNPVSFYYCFDPDGETLRAILAEITNTPWGERHAYVLDVAKAGHPGSSGRIHAWAFDKRFHVSPFLPMQLRYDWRFETPGEHLAVHMIANDAEGPIFDASLDLRRHPLDGAQLAKFLLGFPAITAQVLLKIYWNALLIRLKRNPFYAHPNPS